MYWNNYLMCQFTTTILGKFIIKNTQSINVQYNNKPKKIKIVYDYNVNNVFSMIEHNAHNN